MKTLDYLHLDEKKVQGVVSALLILPFFKLSKL